MADSFKDLINEKRLKRFKDKLDGIVSQKVSKSGDTMTGELHLDIPLETTSGGTGNEKGWAKAIDAVVLTTGSDLDTLTERGEYAAWGDSLAKSIVNKPDEVVRAFILYVDSYYTNDTSGNESKFVNQILIERPLSASSNYSPTIYYRGSYSGSFTSWKKIQNVDDVNDLTTGINLIRGSRDFIKTETVFPKNTDYFYSGAGSGYEIIKPDNDFAVVRYNNNNTTTKYFYLPTITEGFKKGDSFTLSFEVNFHELPNGYSSLGSFIHRSAANTSKTVTYLATSTINPTVTDNWYSVSYVLTLTQDIEEGDYLAVWISLLNANVSFRKFMIQRGKINNPIWSASPFDYAEGSVDDFTTGINLIRGTRDFKSGVTNVHTDGGFAPGSSYDALTFYKDQDGFTVAKRVQSGLSSPNYFSISSSSIVGIQKDELYTVSFEFMVDDVAALDSKVILNMSLYNNTGSRINTLDVTYSTILGINDLESGKWYNAVYVYKVPIETDERYFLNTILRLNQNGSINFRKLMVQRGKVNHPIWNASPFDYVVGPVNDITSNINLIRGTKDFTVGSKTSSRNSVVFEDGFTKVHSEVTFERDSQNFMVAHAKATALRNVYCSAIYGDFVPGDVLTFFGEYKLDEALTAAQVLYQCQIYDGPSSKITVNPSVPTTAEPNVWHKFKLNITIPEGYNDQTYLTIPRINFPVNVGVSFKKLGVYKGNIQNPIWNFNPQDLVTTPVDAEKLGINDMTTGLNLIPGTRDFKEGSESYPGSSTAFYYDGFKQFSGYTLDKDEYGFTIAKKVIPASGTSSAHLLLPTVILEPDTTAITVSFDIMFDSDVPLEANYNLRAEIYGSTSNKLSDTAYLAERLGINGYADMVYDVWHNVVLHISLPAGTRFIYFTNVLNKAGSLNLRKFSVQKGIINNPVWAPAPSDLTLNVNDNTTGLNLVHGTRDFKEGTKKFGSTNYYFDGVRTQTGGTPVKTVDANGFTSFRFSDSDGALNTNWLIADTFEINDVINISLEFDVNAEITGADLFGIANIYKVTNDNQLEKLWTINGAEAGYTKDQLVVGGSYKVNYNYTIPRNIDLVESALIIALTCNPSGKMSYKKLMVQRGPVNNPIWAPSPGELILEPNNDMTTGINLLRGTRDFTLGRISAGVRETMYSDGISFSSSQWKVVSPDNPNEFAYIERIPTGSASHAYFNPLFPDQASGKQFTVSLEFMIFETPSNDPTLFQILVNNNKDANYSYNTSFNTASCGLTDRSLIPLGEWVKVSKTFTIPEMKENEYVRFGIMGSSNEAVGIKRIRKVKVEYGNIVNPVWSASPFDVSSSQIEASAPKYLGTLPLANIIPENADLDDYLVAGTYGCTTDSRCQTLKNKPTDLTNAFTMDVSYTQGTQNDTFSYAIRQRIMILTDAATEFIRTKRNGTWSSWRQTYANTTVRPIEGGGTGRTDGLAQGVVPKVLTNGVNLNDYFAPGFYVATSNAIAQSLVNTPCNVAFTMLVSNSPGGSGYYHQIVFPHGNSGKPYVRTRAGGNADALPTAWVSLASTNDVNAILNNKVTTADIDAMFAGTYQASTNAKVVDDAAIDYAIQKLKEL